MSEQTPADRLEFLLDRVAAFDGRPESRLLGMVEEVLTPEQWDALESVAERRLQAATAGDVDRVKAREYGKEASRRESRQGTAQQAGEAPGRVACRLQFNRIGA